MIRVKSARGTDGGKDESTRPEFSVDTTGGRGPLVFGLTLTAVLLYLKSFLPAAQASQAPEEGDASIPPSEPAAPGEQPGDAVAAPKPEAPAPVAKPQSEPSAQAATLAVQWSGAADAGLPAVASMPPFVAVANLPAPPPPMRSPSWFPAEELTIRFPGPGDFGEAPGASVEVGSDLGSGAAEADTSSDDEAPTAPPNRAPRNTGPVYLADLAPSALLFITFSMLLQQSVDADEDELRVTKVEAARGTLVPEPGGWTYIPDPDAGPGPVSFRYTISDGTAEVEQIAVLRIVPDATGSTAPATAVMADAPEDDGLASGPVAEDAAVTDAGAVAPAGSAGGVLHGSAGDDILVGGDANDIAFGGAGHDMISGGKGDDRLHGEDGNDTLAGGDGNDELAGGAGDDRLEGEDGNDTLAGDEGNDVLAGGNGDDHLDGGAGDDCLEDDAGADIVEGGAGADHILAASDGEDDVFSGGEGHDLLDYGADTLGVAFDIAQGVAAGAGIGTDAFDSIEAFSGGAGDDLFLAAGSCGTFTGGQGDDRYVFEAPRLDFDAGSLRFQITDFSVGDLISLGAINMFQRAGARRFDEEDFMEDIYDTLKEYDFGDARPRLRLREDKADDVERTLIEIDFDRDSTYEMTITLEGGNLVALFDVS